MNATLQKPLKILLLGGTSEAQHLAKRLAQLSGITATMSLAGRTRNAAPSPLPALIGGFGGIDGLADYLMRETIGLVVDATHPFAVQISNNAVAACGKTNVPLLAIERPPWKKEMGDDWREHPTVEEAVAALPDTPTTVFSALGRSSVPLLCERPQHRYLIRVVDPILPPPELPNAIFISSRGPFRTEDDVSLFREHKVSCLLAKNSGGDAAYAKIEAARRLRLPVHMVNRPKIAERHAVLTVDEAMTWIARHHSALTERGV
jgi:precorrin-6A/cobalt-precorrin-6A reductase